jgi:hypothetical protein
MLTSPRSGAPPVMMYFPKVTLAPLDIPFYAQPYAKQIKKAFSA